jgi:hypothetical protein
MTAECFWRQMWNRPQVNTLLAAEVSLANNGTLYDAWRLVSLEPPGRPRVGGGWGGRIRTCAWRHQKPLPYRLATPQSRADISPGARHRQVPPVD